MRRVAIVAALAVLAGLVGAAGSAPTAAAGVSPGQTLRVSVRGDQSQSDQPSLNPAVSGDGRYVVFSSLDKLDTAALSDSTPTYQVFVRDLVANSTRLLTFVPQVDSEAGTTKARPANGHSGLPAISASGRYVAVQTTSSDLFGSGPSDHSKIILIDRDPDADGTLDEPVGDTIQLAWTQLNDTAANAPEAFMPSISGDGQTVVWEEHPPGSPSQIVVAKLGGAGTTGAVGTTALVRQVLSPTQPGLVSNGVWAPAISGNGLRVVAQADYKVPPVVVKTLLRPGGAVATPAPAEHVAAAAPSGHWASQRSSDEHWDARIPARGTLAALQADPPVGERVIGFDLSAVNSVGVVAATRLDVTAGGAPFGAHLGGDRPLLSDDGTLAVFELGVEPCGSCEFPTEPRAFLAKVDTDGNGAIGPVSVDTLSRDNAGNPVRAIMPAISGDGRYAAFVTDAQLTHNGIDQPGDIDCANPRGIIDLRMAAAQTFKSCQIVVRDLVLDAARAAADPPLSRLPGELASPGTQPSCADPVPAGATCGSHGVAELPALSDTGNVVAYTSGAQDLVAGDDNGETDVFARRFTPGVQVAPVDFGGVQVGDTSSLGVTVTPVGFGPLTIEALSVTGTDYTLGLTTCPNVVLHVESTCAATVDFTPKAEGTRTGSLLVKPGFVAEVPTPVTGVGTAFPQPDPAFEATPDPLEFGERLIFTDSAAGVVTVRNAGTRRLVIDAVSLPPLAAPAAPGDYRVTASTCVGTTLSPGASCTVTLVHQPRGPGARAAVLQLDQRVPTDPPTTQPHLLQLLGAGTAPFVQVNPGVVTVGRPTRVIGTGFPPGQPVSILLPGFPELEHATPNAAGTFTRELLVFPNSVPGNRVLTVTVDVDPAIGGTTTLLVVPGTIGPPDFLVRR